MNNTKLYRWWKGGEWARDEERGWALVDPDCNYWMRFGNTHVHRTNLGIVEREYWTTPARWIAFMDWVIFLVMSIAVTWFIWLIYADPNGGWLGAVTMGGLVFYGWKAREILR